MKQAVFILTVSFISLTGNFHSTFAWDAYKAPELKAANGVTLYEKKPLPSLKEIRRRIQEQGYSFTVGETWVYTLPPGEMHKLLGFIPCDHDASRLQKLFPREEIPSSFDWRDTNKVTSVKEKGKCGTCWAHAALADLESKILIAEGEAYNLSEQNLASCAIGVASLLYTSCSGGSPFRSTNFLSQVGASLESCAPYRGTSWAPCKKLCRNIKKVNI